MVDPEKLRALVEIMTEHDLCELAYKSGEEEIVLKRPGGTEATTNTGPHMIFSPQMPAGYAGGGHTQPVAAPPSAPVAPPDADAGLVPIKSPMVGTFYATPGPDAPPFITEGARVSPNSVVCIVEAMKVFNEIKAEVAGTVKKVLVKNEDPVEFGQPLFLVKPD